MKFSIHTQKKSHDPYHLVMKPDIYWRWLLAAALLAVLLTVGLSYYVLFSTQSELSVVPVAMTGENKPLTAALFAPVFTFFDHRADALVLLKQNPPTIFDPAIMR